MTNYSNYQELFEKNSKGQYLANTNDLYQSRFLPLLQRAEEAIKKMIVKYLWENKSVYDLRNIIRAYIEDFDKNKLPKDIENRESYILGLYQMSNKVYNEQIKARKEFSIVLGLLVSAYALKGLKTPKINAPEELATFITKHKREIVNLDMWSQAKASVRVQQYPKKIEEYIKRTSEIPTLAVEEGKKSISIWQKAELDIRHEKQMKMVEDAKNSGDDLYYISSHPDCSKRCEKWQGKLVSVTRHATMSGFRVEKVDNQWVYSLTDIMAQKDKYGYNNNIICGFNCRHYLIKYESGKKPPKEYSKEDVKRMREINDQIRLAERKIREMRTQQLMFKQVGNRKEYMRLDREIAQAIRNLREYCDKNGFAFQEYRVK